jgi:hypothetical protein
VSGKKIIHGVACAVCVFYLTLGLGTVRQAGAARHDMEMFHAALAPYGRWIDYGKYGPVWSPTRVSSSWRPYLNGRWAPSHAGWVFETAEPWGWATYHYGNWMPTTSYGWVWSPGSTWYPSTVAWRSSNDYIGWAPIPPPDYAPEPAFYPAGGYNPEAPLLDALAAPLWIFIRAAQFLLGFGQPFTPAYSYYNSTNILAPLSYAPIVYGATSLLTDFYYPGYAPGAYYSFGPPFAYVSRVTNVNVQEIYGYVNHYNYPRLRNVLPPPDLVQRYPYLREGIPPAVLEGRRFPVTRVQDVARVEQDLNRPGVLPPVAKLPLPATRIPTVMPSHRLVSPNNLGRIRGMALPYQATIPLTATMRQQIRLQRQIPGQQRIETRPEFRPLAKPEFVPPVHESVPRIPTSGIQPPEGRAGQPSPALPPGRFQSAPSREFRAPAAERYRPALPREYFRPSARFRPAIPREFRAAPAPVYRSAPRQVFHPPAPMRRAFSPRPHAPAAAHPTPFHPQGPARR